MAREWPRPGPVGYLTYLEWVERVIVVGGPGSGKSTLAREAATALSAVHIELDSIWWRQGWVHLEPVDFLNAIRDRLSSSPKWVVDGNYIDEIAQSVWPLADTLVWLDIRRHVAFRRAVARSIRRVLTRQKLWNGNRETLGVLHPRSLHRLWTRWPGYSERIQVTLEVGGASHLTVVRLATRRDVQRWLRGLARL